MKSFKKILFLNFIFILILFTYTNYIYATNTPEISSPAALLMDAASGKILYEKDIYSKRYPASITKVLTAIIVIENCDLNDVAVVSQAAVDSIEQDYVSANLQKDEEIIVKDLINVLLVGSANDAAVVLAEYCFGDVDTFVQEMNKRATEIGCLNSNFTNPSGLHNENHYSTAYDLALIGQYAMGNDVFKEIVKKISYTLPATNKYEFNDRFFSNNNTLLYKNLTIPENDTYYQYATGIKTGFTTPAGNCLLASSSKNNFELISVVLGAAHDSILFNQRFKDTTALFNYGYETFAVKTIATASSTVHTINISNATVNTKKLNLILEEDAVVIVKNENFNDFILPKIKLNSKIRAPIKKGEVLGTITYESEDILYEYRLVAEKDVNASYLLHAILILILFAILFRLKNKRKIKKIVRKNKKRR